MGCCVTRWRTRQANVRTERRWRHHVFFDMSIGEKHVRIEGPPKVPNLAYLCSRMLMKAKIK